jgi:hypothetical protein
MRTQRRLPKVASSLDRKRAELVRLEQKVVKLKADIIKLEPCDPIRPSRPDSERHPFPYLDVGMT